MGRIDAAADPVEVLRSGARPGQPSALQRSAPIRSAAGPAPAGERGNRLASGNKLLSMASSRSAAGPRCHLFAPAAGEDGSGGPREGWGERENSLFRRGFWGGLGADPIRDLVGRVAIFEFNILSGKLSGAEKKSDRPSGTGLSKLAAHLRAARSNKCCPWREDHRNLQLCQ